MNSNKNTKFNEWYMKINPPVWIDADFGVMKIPMSGGSESHFRSDPQRKTLFINKPLAVGYKIVKNP